MTRRVDLDGRVVLTTKQAVLYRSNADRTETYIPRSVLLDGDTLEFGDTDLVCDEWFVNKEDLR